MTKALPKIESIKVGKVTVQRVNDLNFDFAEFGIYTLHQWKIHVVSDEGWMDGDHLYPEELRPETKFIAESLHGDRHGIIQCATREEADNLEKEFWDEWRIDPMEQRFPSPEYQQKW